MLWLATRLQWTPRISCRLQPSQNSSQVSIQSSKTSPLIKTLLARKLQCEYNQLNATLLRCKIIRFTREQYLWWSRRSLRLSRSAPNWPRVEIKVKILTRTEINTRVNSMSHPLGCLKLRWGIMSRTVVLKSENLDPRWPDCPAIVKRRASSSIV